MKLIAASTIHGLKVKRPRNPNNAKDRGESERKVAMPGEEFDTAEFGISDDEARALVTGKFAKHKMVRAEADAPAADAPQA